MSHISMLIQDAYDSCQRAAIAPHAHSDVAPLKTPEIESGVYVEMLPSTRHRGVVTRLFSDYGYISWLSEKRDLRFARKNPSIVEFTRVTFKINHLTMTAYDVQIEGWEITRPTAPKRESAKQAFERRKAENAAKRANTLTMMRTTDGLYDIDDLAAYDDIDPTF